MKKYIDTGIHVIEADEGKILVSGELSAEIVYLGKEDTGSDWIEQDFTYIETEL